MEPATRRTTPKLGEPSDRFEVVRDSLFYKTRDSARSVPFGPSTFYRLFSFTPYQQALLARFLELENYERAGIPAPEVLRIATFVPAQVMKDDKDYGSVAVGKVADIIIIDGKPAERVSDLRKIERVIRAGRAYDPKALRAAIGDR